MDIQLRRLAGQPLAQTLRIRGHSLVVDGSVATGGGDLGACKAITVLSYARRKGIPVDEIETDVLRDASQERAGTYRLETRLRIRGALSDAQLQELARVAEKCPVHKLMSTVVTEIGTDVQRLP
jgi:putative redox protein